MRLENVTSETQSIFVEDKRIQLRPLEDKNFSDEVATQFLRERGRQVRPYRENSVPPLLANQAPHWIANMTGSPFVPATYKIQQINKKTGDYEDVTVPNPVATPATIHERMSVGQGQDPYNRFVIDANDKDFNLMPVDIFIRAGTRAMISENVMEFMLRRDAQEGELKMGKSIESRPPSAFEPTIMWKMNEIVFYAYLVDGKKFSEEEISKIIKLCNDGKMVTAEALMEHPEVEEDIKNVLLKRLQYCLIDPNFSLPTKAYFDKALAESKVKASKKSATSHVIQPTV